jgi:hypothetical protein
MSLLECLVFYLLWYEVTMVRIDTVVWAWVGIVEMVGFRQVLWIVMLKFARDQILGVDTPRQ